jgi:CHAD domain-containing protein
MRRALRTPAGPARDVALHEARKAAKRARYAAEVARPASGKRARQFAKQMKAIQSVLGDHQDTVNARAVARELGVHANLAGESSFSFGLLYERAYRDAHEHEELAGHVWKRAVHGKAIRWLT